MSKKQTKPNTDFDLIFQMSVKQIKLNNNQRGKPQIKIMNGQNNQSLITQNQSRKNPKKERRSKSQVSNNNIETTMAVREVRGICKKCSV